MASECFRTRRLLWDELKLQVRAAEEEELRATIGGYRIAENEELRGELVTLADILSEFQQQNDSIRDALAARRSVPEPSGRPLLLEKLKLLAADLELRSPREALRSAEDRRVLDYVVAAGDDAPRRSLRTPRAADASRPGSGGGGRRPLTSGSLRPVSRGSTLSASSASAVLESPEVREQLTVERIDGVKGELRQALEEERQLLLEDIEFLQGCLEMEKDLIDEDRRAVARPPPSLGELQALGRVLEKSLAEQVEREQLEALLSRTGAPAGGAVCQRLPRTSPRESPAAAPARRDSRPRVLKVRRAIQEARDEPFLS